MPAIKIHVHENDQKAGEKKGTFLHPYPKVRVAKNAEVSWKLLNRGAKFELRFSGFKSPFSSKELSISDEKPRKAVNKGLYHYSVRVTKAGKYSHVINGCPEFEVTGGS